MCAALCDGDREAARPHRRVGWTRRTGTGGSGCGCSTSTPATFHRRLQRHRELGAVVRPPPALPDAAGAGLRRASSAASGRRTRPTTAPSPTRSPTRPPTGAARARAGLPPDAGAPACCASCAPTCGSATSRTPRGRRVDYFRLLPDDIARAGAARHARRRPRRLPHPRWADAFAACCAEVLGATVRRHRAVTHAGRHHADRRARARRRRRTSCATRGQAATCERRMAALREQIGDRAGRSCGWTAPSCPRTSCAACRPTGELLRDRPGVARPRRPRRVRLPLAGRTCRSTATTPPRCSGSPTEINDEFGTRRLAAGRAAGQGRLRPLAGRLPAGRRAAGQPDPGRHEPGRQGGPGRLGRRLRAGAVAGGGRVRGAGRGRAHGQPVRRHGHRRGAARGAVDAGRRAGGAHEAAGRGGDRAAPEQWFTDQVAALD